MATREEILQSQRRSMDRLATPQTPRTARAGNGTHASASASARPQPQFAAVSEPNPKAAHFFRVQQQSAAGRFPKIDKPSAKSTPRSAAGLAPKSPTKLPAIEGSFRGSSSGMAGTSSTRGRLRPRPNLGVEIDGPATDSEEDANEAVDPFAKSIMSFEARQRQARVDEENDDDNGGGGHVNATDRQSQELIRRLFSLKLSEKSVVRKRLSERGLDSVMASMNQVSKRYGVRMMTLDDFHFALSQILTNKDETLPAGESKMLFNLFDDNRSGIVDMEEFELGMKLLLQDESVVLRNHCRSVVLDDHVPLDGTVSILEANLMFRATAIYHDHAEPLLAAMERVRKLVWHDAHQGQVNVEMFRSYIEREPLLQDAIEALPLPDGTDPRAKPPSPDPEAAIGALSLVHARMHRKETQADERGEEGSGNREGRGLAYESMDFYNPRFRADEYLDRNERRQLDAKENGNPSFFVLSERIYKQMDSGEPIPVFDV